MIRIAAAAVFVLITYPVFPHNAPSGWSYDTSCCSSTDCYQAPDGDVKETSTGYQLSTGETIAYGDHRIKRSHDEFFHECKPHGDVNAKRSYCLYVPDRSY